MLMCPGSYRRTWAVAANLRLVPCVGITGSRAASLPRMALSVVQSSRQEQSEVGQLAVLQRVSGRSGKRFTDFCSNR